MSFAIEGFQAVAQNYIPQGISSNFYKKSALLTALGALGLGNNNKKDPFSIGRPGVGEVLSGANLSPVQKQALVGVNSYRPRFQNFSTSNTGRRSTRGSLPDVANKTTRSHGQAGQYAFDFKWTHLDTPILIWHEDKIRCEGEATRDGQKVALGELIQQSTEVGLQDMIDTLSEDVYSGNPTNQGVDLWDYPLGVFHAFVSSGIYGNVDVGVETNAAANVDSTLTSVDIGAIVDKANLDYLARITGTGDGIDLILTSTTLYKQFKAQIGSSSSHMTNQAVQKMASMGYTGEVLVKDNVVIMYDPKIATSGGASGATDNMVFAYTTRNWVFIINKLFNFNVDPFVDNTKTGIAKETYDYAYAHLRYILACRNPKQQTKFTAIGT